MKPLLFAASVSLLFAPPAFADSGFIGSAALSGAGQGLANASSQMMNLYGASALQQQQFEHQLRMQQRQLEFQEQYQRQLQQRQLDAQEAQATRVKQAQRVAEIIAGYRQDATDLDAKKAELDARDATLKQEEDGWWHRIKVGDLRTEMGWHNKKVAAYKQKMDDEEMARLVTWGSCENRQWCGLSTINPKSVHAVGVYMVWINTTNTPIVTIGHGNIASEIAFAQINPEVMRFQSHGRLMVSWIHVPDHQQRGIERYLRESLRPLDGVPVHNVPPIGVNFPVD